MIQVEIKKNMVIFDILELLIMQMNNKMYFLKWIEGWSRNFQFTQ